MGNCFKKLPVKSVVYTVIRNVYYNIYLHLYLLSLEVKGNWVILGKIEINITTFSFMKEFNGKQVSEKRKVLCS
jgi:hypothetical protein